MANLFFIQTPFQLLIAQQIIYQEGLVDNIMIYGYVHNNSHFLDIYNIIKIRKFWKTSFFMSHIADWGIFQIRHFRKSVKLTWCNVNFINDVIKKSSVDWLYIGDQTNVTYILIDYLFHKRCKIGIFEEGSGHYFMPHRKKNEKVSLKTKLHSYLLCFGYYWPFLNIDLRYIKMAKGYDLKKLYIDRRYSVVPYYYEPFDVILSSKLQLSNALKQYIIDELGKVDPQKSVLLLSTVCESNVEKDLYLSNLNNYLLRLNMETKLYVKFHPREPENSKCQVLNIIDSYGLDYTIIGVRYNIPIEYYLQYFKFREVCCFFTSTSLYNGYLFDKTKFLFLSKDYINQSKAFDSANLYWKEMSKIIELSE